MSACIISMISKYPSTLKRQGLNYGYLYVNYRTLPSQHILFNGIFLSCDSNWKQYTSCSAGDKSQGFIKAKNFTSTQLQPHSPFALSWHVPGPWPSVVRCLAKLIFIILACLLYCLPHKAYAFLSRRGGELSG